MRILVVSNLYPPHFRGGYELGCSLMTEALEARGHEIRVLTSVYGVGKPVTDGRVYRWLRSAYDWQIGNTIQFGAQLLRMEIGNQAALSRICRKWPPDLIYFWNLGGLPMSIVTRAQDMGTPTCFFIFDNWLSRWQDEVWNWLRTGRPERFSGRVVQTGLRIFLGASAGFRPMSRPDLHHVQFGSHFLQQMYRDVGCPVSDGSVIDWGIDLAHFPFRAAPVRPQRLIYVGRIVPEKGVHTALQAFNILTGHKEYRAMTLTVVGGASDESYLTRLRELARAAGREQQVRFTGTLSPERVRLALSEHDMLIFPSVWVEPFGITILEAMASGLAVVGTGTGGSGEIMEHDVNSLVFAKEDAQDCAAQLQRLVQEPATFERIRRQGRHTVESRYTSGGMSDQIEKALRQVREVLSESDVQAANRNQR